MSKKIVLVAFNGEAMCFVHVLLNALDMDAHGQDVKIIIEGSATSLIKNLADPDNPFAELYQRVCKKGLIDCVCKACATKTGSLEAAQKQGLKIKGEMNGHPALRHFIDDGYDIITF